MVGIKSILKLYKSNNFISAKKILFSSVGKNDVYNISKQFKVGKVNYILGRVEPRDDASSSKVMFFRKKKGSKYWHPDSRCKVFDLEDPFITKIGNEFVVGGVYVDWNSAKARWKTIFYKGKNVYSLTKFTAGPWGMKDIRLIELPNSKIGVFTRPQGKRGNRGKIGFTIINNLSELKPRRLSSAKLIENQFTRGEWGGVNDCVILKNNKIGVLGHIARYSEDKKNRFYYPIVFSFDYINRESSPLRLILRRAELPECESKIPGLYNVVFPGGIIRNGETATLYVGVGDAEAYKVEIKDPFLYYEKE